MVAEDAITTEEALADLVAEEVLLQEEKEVLLQEEKVLADLEATEVLHLEKAVLDQEAHLLQEEKVAFHLTDLQEKALQKEHQDVLKVLVMHQDQEDQEETNYNLVFLNNESPEYFGRFFFTLSLFFWQIQIDKI